jgi:hypothetical protein
MKTKIGAAIIALFFLMSCGSSEQKTEDQKQSETKQNLKFILRASTFKYVTIGADSILVANQSDPTKAEVFEKVDLENGKSAIRASNGKFVSDNRANQSKIDAFRDQASGWEEFEIIAVDQTKVNIKSSAGKFVSADQSKGDRLVADRDKAGAWETFDLEPK